MERADEFDDASTTFSIDGSRIPRYGEDGMYGLGKLLIYVIIPIHGLSRLFTCLLSVAENVNGR